MSRIPHSNQSYSNLSEQNLEVIDKHNKDHQMIKNMIIGLYKIAEHTTVIGLLIPVIKRAAVAYLDKGLVDIPNKVQHKAKHKADDI